MHSRFLLNVTGIAGANGIDGSAVVDATNGGVGGTASVISQFGQAVFRCLRAARKIHKSSASFGYCVRVALRGGCDADLWAFSTPG
jgi:hypothetical protein